MDYPKELLPLAARAMGLWPSPEPIEHVLNRWNPLTPGDGAEMEDKLGISVSRSKDAVRSLTSMFSCGELYADHPDEGAARRWASLRVAAAIGRSMK